MNASSRRVPGALASATHLALLLAIIVVASAPAPASAQSTIAAPLASVGTGGTHPRTSGPYTKINSALLTEPTYDDTAINALLPRLFYVVTAVDTSDNESAFSAEIRGKASPSLR